MVALKWNSNIVFLIVALALGIGASLMATRYVEAQVAARTAAPVQAKRQVVVPQRDLAAGESLSAADVAARPVPVEFIPADALTVDTYEAYLDQKLRSPLTQGAPIPASAIERLNDRFSGILAAGQVAYTMQVDEANSVAGMIMPGDRIDVLLLSGEGANETLRPLLADVPVLATGRRAPGLRDSEDDDHYSNMTLQLSPRDAQRIAVARKAGELHVLLRAAGDGAPFGLRALGKADLFRSTPGARAAAGIQFIIGGQQ